MEQRGMEKRMTSICRLSSFAFAAFLSCASAEGGVFEKNDAAKTIVRYNEGLAIAGRSGKVDHLKLFASEQIVQKTYLWIHSWQDSNYYMRAEPQKIDFTDIRMEGNVSNVRTREEWEYDYYDAASKKPSMPKTRAVYEMRYALHSHHGKWVIDEIKILNEKHIPIDGNGAQPKAENR